MKKIRVADFVRDPELFLAAKAFFNRTEFHWRAGTPAVDEDVDPPKRKATA